jgi:hypothetical protein
LDVSNSLSRSTLDALRQLLGTVILVQEVVGDFLQISEMAVEKGGSNGEEVGVAGVINLNDTPGILAGADLATTNLDNILGANNGEWHETSQLGILLNSVLVILLDIVREVVDGNSVVLNVLHDQLLGLGQLSGSKGVGATDDGDDVDAGGKSLHELNVEFSETVEL